MSWLGILGHDGVVEQLRRALIRGRLAASFLWVGPAGVGKRTFALRLAQAMLCRRHREEELEACGACPSCAQVVAGTHPDLHVVCKPEEKSFLPLELLIGDKDHRMRQGLCHDIAIKPFMGGRKIAVIDDADYLNAEGANSLLKTLEEPPPRSVLILIGTSAARQLPTIRSRCQLIRFRPLPADALAAILVERGLVDDASEAERLAAHAGGSVQAAMTLRDPELWSFRNVLLSGLAEFPVDGVRLATAVTSFVEAAGKEAPLRRARLRQVLGMATDFYAATARRLAGAATIGDAELLQASQRAAARWQGDIETAAACADRCLEAAEQVDRNAHTTTLIETWLDDLARSATRVPAR
jgi:DNA polymerase-3 subunit delta'